MLGMAKKGRRATEEERLHAVRLMESGKSPEVVAEILDVSRSSVFEWQKKYREGGLSALSTKLASGRPTVLSDEQLTLLYSMIVGHDPRQYDLGYALWTRKIVARIVEQTFGEDLSLPTVGRILKKLGMSAPRPLCRENQQDSERIRLWKERIYPSVRASATRTGATIFMVNEVKIHPGRHADTPSAPIGRTPEIITAAAERPVTMVSAISTRGQLHFAVFDNGMNATRFIEFCEKLLHDCATPGFLVIEGGLARTAEVAKKYVRSTEGRLRFFPLP